MHQRSPVLPVDSVLPPGRLFVLGFQHVLAMYVGAVTVPLIVARGIGLSEAQLVALINADLFTCGIATLIQALGIGRIGIRLPIVQGVTFAAVTPMIVIGKSQGMPAVYGAVIAAGAITFFVSPYFSRIADRFPSRVIGTVVTLIGLSLFPVALRWAQGGSPSSPRFGQPSTLALSFFVLFLILLFQRWLTGFWKSLSVLLGLVAGTLVSIPFGWLHFDSIRRAPWFGVTKPFAFGLPVFDIWAVFSLLVVMLVVMIETTGDFIAIGEIVDKPVNTDDLTRGLRADGLSTVLGGIFNSFPYTAYAQNVGLVSLTQVKSRFVVAAAGGILVALGHFPKAGALIASVPAPVLGGCGIAMFGMVAASGLSILSRVPLRGTFDGLVVGVSLAIGMIPIAAPDFFQHFPSNLQAFFNSGITLGSLCVLTVGLLAPRRSTRL